MTDPALDPLLDLADPDTNRDAFLARWPRLDPVLQAGRQTLAPLIAWNARRFGIPAPELEPHLWRAMAGDARAQALLERLLAACKAARVPALLLKGEHLARTVYPETWLRPRADIDLLVLRDRVRGLVRALERRGFVADEREHSLDHALRAKDEVTLFPPAPFTIPVELHWRSAYLTAWSRKLGVRGLWRRAARIGSGLYGLSPEDLGLYLCLHLAKHGFGGNPIWLLDLRLWLRRGGADLERFRRRAARVGTIEVVEAALACATTPGTTANPELDRARVKASSRLGRSWDPLLEALRQPDLEARLHALRRLVLPPELVLRRLYPDAGNARPWTLRARRLFDATVANLRQGG